MHENYDNSEVGFNENMRGQKILMLDRLEHAEEREDALLSKTFELKKRLNANEAK